jgi:hypothetical protein
MFEWNEDQLADVNYFYLSVTNQAAPLQEGAALNIESGCCKREPE